MRSFARTGDARARRVGRALLALYLVAGGFPVAAARSQGTGLGTWFGRLRVGMWVKVEGMRTPDGVLQAAKIKIYDGELDEVEVESYVAAVDLVRLTVETSIGVRVVVTPTTEVEGPKPHDNVSLAFLEVGDRVEIEGHLQKDGSLLAEKIDIEKSRRLEPDSKLENKHELTARIESIDTAPHRIVVLGTPVQLSEGTRNKSPLPY